MTVGLVEHRSFPPQRVFSNYNNNNNNNNNNDKIERRNSRFVCNLLTAPQTVSNVYAQVVQAQSSANHVQLVKRSSHATCATWYEGKAQILSLTELKSHVF